MVAIYGTRSFRLIPFVTNKATIVSTSPQHFLSIDISLGYLFYCYFDCYLFWIIRSDGADFEVDSFENYRIRTYAMKVKALLSRLRE